MVQKSLLLPLRLLLKLVVSPFLLFVLGYIYFGDMRKAYYLALLGYTIITFSTLILTGITILPTMARFNVLKFIRKSFKAVSMTIALGVYWLTYIIFWGTNFGL